MDQFLLDVQQEMVGMGWGSAAAAQQINFDPDHLLEMKAEGISVIDAALEVVRQYESRHFTAV